MEKVQMLLAGLQRYPLISEWQTVFFSFFFLFASVSSQKNKIDLITDPAKCRISCSFIVIMPTLVSLNMDYNCQNCPLFLVDPISLKHFNWTSIAPEDLKVLGPISLHASPKPSNSNCGFLMFECQTSVPPSVYPHRPLHRPYQL